MNEDLTSGLGRTGDGTEVAGHASPQVPSCLEAGKSRPTSASAENVPATDPSLSYRRIFRSTGLVGGTQVVNIAIGMGRTKALALWLGPAGVGVAGMYQSATGVIGTLTGLGLGMAGVREIAAAVGTGDRARVARTVDVVRRLSGISGLLGMILVLALASPLAKATFGDDAHGGGLALVSLTLLFGGLATGHSALLQGLRRLRDLAACSILGTLFGSAVSVALVWRFQDEGIAPYLVAVAAFGSLSAWWYARRIDVPRVRLGVGATLREARPLLRLGAAFVLSGLIFAAVAWVTRMLIVRELGIEAVGLYTAASTLSSVYVGVVLSAMGADFYPRLTAVAHDNAAVNELVNQQTEMGVLMALPGILATLVLAPWIVRVLYSAEFVGATDVVRWQIVGVGLRVVSWPLGFVQLAKGRGRVFAATELVFSSMHIGLLYVAVRWWGLAGTGIALAATYALYTAGMMAVCRRLSGFSWARRVAVTIALGMTSVIIAIASISAANTSWGTPIAGVLTLVVASICVTKVRSRIRGVFGTP